MFNFASVRRIQTLLILRIPRRVMNATIHLLFPGLLSVNFHPEGDFIFSSVDILCTMIFDHIVVLLMEIRVYTLLEKTL